MCAASAASMLVLNELMIAGHKHVAVELCSDESAFAKCQNVVVLKCAQKKQFAVRLIIYFERLANFPNALRNSTSGEHAHMFRLPGGENR
jgi:hypothetical protein